MPRDEGFTSTSDSFTTSAPSSTASISTALTSRAFSLASSHLHPRHLHPRHFHPRHLHPRDSHHVLPQSPHASRPGGRLASLEDDFGPLRGSHERPVPYRSGDSRAASRAASSRPSAKGCLRARLRARGSEGSYPHLRSFQLCTRAPIKEVQPVFRYEVFRYEAAGSSRRA